MENSTSNARRQAGKNDCQAQVGDFFEKLLMWRDESQRQFLNLVNDHSKNINEAINNLVTEVSDLEVQLSVTRKERNDLIETVKNMSGKMQKLPDNEDNLGEFGPTETNKTIFEEQMSSNTEEVSQEIGDISDEILNQQILKVENTENNSTLIRKTVDTCVKREEYPVNNFKMADKNNEDRFVSRNHPESINRQTEHEMNLEHENLQVEDEADSVTTDNKAKVALPFFGLQLGRNPNNRVGKVKLNFSSDKTVMKGSRWDSGKKFKCDHCLYSSDNNQHLKKHINIMHLKVEKKYKCDKCPYASHSNFHLNEHISTKHIKTMNFACGECDFRTISRGRLSKHRSHAGHKSQDRKFSCKICSYSSGDKDTLFDHIQDKHFQQ